MEDYVDFGRVGGYGDFEVWATTAIYGVEDYVDFGHVEGNFGVWANTAIEGVESYGNFGHVGDYGDFGVRATTPI